MYGFSREEARVKGFEREGRSLGDERRDGRPRVRRERAREARRAEKRTFDRKWMNIDRWKSRACRSSFGFIGGETVPSVSGGFGRGGGPDRISSMGGARRWLVLFRWANRTNGPDLTGRHNLRRLAAPRSNHGELQGLARNLGPTRGARRERARERAGGVRRHPDPAANPKFSKSTPLEVA